MFPPWFLPTFYTVSGVLVAYLSYRIWRKNQAPQLPNVPPVYSSRMTEVQPEAIRERATSAASSVASTATRLTDDATSGAAYPGVDLSILKAPAAVGSALAGGAAAVGAAAYQSAASASQSATYMATAGQSAARMAAESVANRWADASVTRNPIPPLPTMEADSLPFADANDRAFGPLNSTLASFLPESDARKSDIKKDLNHAGYYSPFALENLSAVRYVAMILALVFFGVLLLIVPPNLEWIAIGGLIAGPILGWAVPRLSIASQAKQRLDRIERAMPDLLDMLNMCVAQGMTVPTALVRVQRELRGVYPDLAKELGIVSDQAKIAGLPVALENFSKRIDLPEVHSFTSLLMQTERMGTSVSAALGDYSDNMRESLKQRAEEKGNRAAFRLLFPTVLCLMPAVYLFLLGPAVIELSRFFYSGRDELGQGTAVIDRINQSRQRVLNNRGDN